LVKGASYDRLKTFDPHSIIGQYGLDLACGLIYRKKPQSLYVQTDELPIARAVVRRFLGCFDEVLVDRIEIAQSISTDYHILARVYNQSEVEAAILPFSRKRWPTPPNAELVVVVAENSISYKSLILPGRVPDSVVAVRRWLAQTHSIQECWGILDPVFIGRIAISKLAGHRIPTLHFWASQRALDNIYVTGLRALVSHITLLTGSLLKS